MAKLACIDLFCGAGGLTHGLISEGVPVVAGIDIDSACRHPFEKNNGARFIQEDVSRTRPAVLKDLFGDADIRILAGCAPCQPFSTYAQRYPTIGSPRWALLYAFARLIESVRPELVVTENVPSVQRHRVYHDFADALRRCGYRVWHGVIDAADYGLPQRRRRLVLLASTLGPITLLGRTHARPTTVREAIGHLPPIPAGGSLDSDPLHAAVRLSSTNLARIRASRPGGTWRDWPPHLIADCHRRDSGRTYPSVYGRMSWDAPAPTLTTQFYAFGSGRFGHPEQDRALSLREGAILQGFPGDYSFTPPDAKVSFRILGGMIGNAVPIPLGKIIGQSILRHLAIASRTRATHVLRHASDMDLESREVRETPPAW